MEEILELDVEPPAPSTCLEPCSFADSGITELINIAMGGSITELPRQKNTKSTFPLNSRSAAFLAKHHPQTSSSQWNDWRWQLKHRITSLAALEKIVDLSPEEREALQPGGNMLPIAVTPYYAALLDRNDPLQPLRRCVIPTMAEHVAMACEEGDPLGEEHDSPVPGIVHRYPDRVLFLITDYCSTYCRYCTRSRRVGKEERPQGPSQWEMGLKYIANNMAVRDVLISGGDPLTMTDHALEYLLQRLRAIPHVEIIRIGTKVPMVLPQRITPRLVQMLRRYHPLFISIHCTHAEELTPEAALACTRLADAGIPLGGQTVLLKGVNDTIPALTSLFQGLLRNRVRPYYLYQCDQVVGTSHFRTKVDKGLELIRGLRGHTSGYAIPHYVVDLPGGGGKTPLCPEYFRGRAGRDLIFENYKGEQYRVHDPAEPDTCPGGMP
ncbi:L-lysine 2,3-aminomutase [Desulfonatronum thiosulfatophilum]|uniref:L-lysine 2,3-aminomutase n=1 Tax=Desulfonatronum thiosulfatophilum TaxID=617002 RepID=A0A1G6C2M9_9BACT|nr:KamA family radical SAM protein [Desulfonatronum thiosulfatophilum]SDB27130.1 L-lysine 2,3-aminomutase [Desulfonatronum thiosulfatophilum]